MITKIKKGQYHRSHKIVIDVLQQIKKLLIHVSTPEKQSVSVFRVEVLVRWDECSVSWHVQIAVSYFPWEGRRYKNLSGPTV